MDRRRFPSPSFRARLVLRETKRPTLTVVLNRVILQSRTLTSAFTELNEQLWCGSFECGGDGVF